MSSTPVLHVRGAILIGPQEERREAWIVGGRITFEEPRHSGALETVSGYVLPGLVDAHCHVGLDQHGAVPPEVAIEQATTDRDAGALLLRDAGSPLDTHFIDEIEDLPRIIRAGGAADLTAAMIASNSFWKPRRASVEPASITVMMATSAAQQAVSMNSETLTLFTGTPELLAALRSPPAAKIQLPTGRRSRT